MDLSIVVVSHEQKELIKQYLPYLFSVPTKASFEVALIDNACEDRTADWVVRNLPQVRVIRNKTKKSFAENMNLGMSELKKGRYFVVFNPDVKCCPGLWDEAVKFMDNNPDVGLMGPQLLNPDLTVQPSCRRFLTPLNLIIRGLHLDSLLKDLNPIKQYLMKDYDHKTVMDVDWVTGALMFVRREAIDMVGGMDERYKKAYAEDQDWCCRMWRGGWRVCCVPQAVAIHDHQQAGRRKPWSMMGLVQLMNNIRLFHKFNWKLSRS